MRKTKSKKPIVAFFLIAFIAIILGLGFYGYFKVLSTDIMYEGVKIDEFDISFMTTEETLKFLKDKKEEEIDKKNMSLTYEDKEYNINLRQLGFYFDYEEAVDSAYLVGREGTVITRIKDIINTKKEGVKITLNSDYDKETVVNIVNKIAQEIDLEMENAKFDFNNGNIKITEEVVGRRVNKEELENLINDNVYDLNPIEIPVEKIMPEKTKEALNRINGVIGEFSTSFTRSSSDRIENIKIASKALSDNLIMPGQTLSFNETTGPRETKFGYKEANVIIAGEFTPGVGGGVCQASTTLYNALLLADVTIVQRSHHSIPASYVKFGQDAAVAYGHLDLRFRNDFDFPIYLNSKVVGDRVYMYVYGDKNSKDYTVRIEPETIETIVAKEEIILDDSLPPGTKELVQKGRTGYKVNTYKSIIKNGKVISRDIITKDFYKPRNFIYRIGPSPDSSNEEGNPTEEKGIDE